MPVSQVSLTQIAEIAHVSRATVSLALRGKPQISESLGRQIRALADRLGYQPNPLVSAHMAYVRRPRRAPALQRLAFVSPFSESEIVASRLPHRVFLRAAAERARHLGYEFEAHRLPGDSAGVRQLERTLLRRKVGGLIFPPFNERAAVAGLELELQPFAAVMIEHAFVEPRLHKVCVDQFSGVCRLLQRLLDYGYRRIGIALPRHMDEHANHSWLAGYSIFRELCAPEARVPHLITDEWTAENFLAWHRHWRPEAIVTIDADILGWLAGAGFRVPEDVACATLSWTRRAPEFGGCYQNCEVVGAAAVDQVAGQLFRNERGVPVEQRTLLVDAGWREGATVPRRTAEGAASTLRLSVREAVAVAAS
ncbi:MAG: LacI family DNA-binding transcriptional regulator [Nocardioides sp.]